jgi:hypothetical protein
LGGARDGPNVGRRRKCLHRHRSPQDIVLTTLCYSVGAESAVNLRRLP